MYKGSSHYPHFETSKKIELCKIWVYGTVVVIIQLMQISTLPPKVVRVGISGDCVSGNCICGGSLYVMPKLYAIQIQMSTFKWNLIASSKRWVIGVTVLHSYSDGAAG